MFLKIQGVKSQGVLADKEMPTSKIFVSGAEMAAVNARQCEQKPMNKIVVEELAEGKNHPSRWTNKLTRSR